jgi:hypothetical protein
MNSSWLVPTHTLGGSLVRPGGLGGSEGEVVFTVDQMGLLALWRSVSSGLRARGSFRLTMEAHTEEAELLKPLTLSPEDSELSTGKGRETNLKGLRGCIHQGPCHKPSQSRSAYSF